ncbi:probable CLC-type chloride channel [Cyanidioschyzon merolae strain 10D]|uniref:Probable CLC-type chloride channel n=1 Tax=Cyanidioschyzon merolae (strain NIES-3377 / 10D) TaxID=280699 RepID=M1UVK6_CYAM1|nr:probable CLC-type chloride channel [Cyanidioschyzon merolae strain 10D]BAM82041.1 probable CLC-type chloride channel [Cyanidioschyzon merolae strain 10D]|eukprot:XP_005538077.1 probable CLC-type chloride channel [Cyanidioschyzon merolae strain 10D]
MSSKITGTLEVDYGLLDSMGNLARHPTPVGTRASESSQQISLEETESGLRLAPYDTGFDANERSYGSVSPRDAYRCWNALGSCTPRGSLMYLLRLVCFLTLLGVTAALFIFAVDLAVHGLEELRMKISRLAGRFAGYILYVVSGVALCLLSTFWCAVLSTEAEGSGLPQMKSILSGFYDKMRSALELRVLFAKALGLICAIGGGLPVGWEGPNVHIACIIAHQFYRLGVFKELCTDRALRLQTLAAACAVGLASSFGAPLGGVLYSIETIASFYLVQAFWKGVLSALSGAIVYELLYTTPLVEAFEGTNFDASDVSRTQTLLYAILGALMGVLGALFIRCVRSIYELRMRHYPGTNRYFLVGVVALFASALQYPFRLFALDPRATINDLFKAVPLYQTDHFGWTELILMPIIKFILVALSIGLPLPAGVFVPSFLIGAGFGRLYGELMRVVFGNAIVPGSYAVVGAAAFTAGVTRALSCAVIIFEVTGQIRHLVPVLISVLLAVIVGNAFNRSLYETLVLMKHLPYMPILRRDRSPEMTAREIMHPIEGEPHLFPDSEPQHIKGILEKFPNRLVFPVIDANGYLLGAISRKEIVDRLQHVLEDVPEPIAGHRTLVLLDAADLSENIEGLVDETPSGEHSSKGKRTATVLEPTSSLVVPCDVSPIVVTSYSLVRQLHFLFVMLMPSMIYVTERGKLVGIVEREDVAYGYREPEQTS